MIKMTARTGVPRGVAPVLPMMRACPLVPATFSIPGVTYLRFWSAATTSLALGNLSAQADVQLVPNPVTHQGN
ncbi:MAG: hypothetical protein ACREA0_08465, partial [bacterium]